MGKKILPNLSDFQRELVKCDLCNDCLDICPIYMKTKMKKFSPIAPIILGSEVGKKGFKYLEEHLENLNSCTLCRRCIEHCPPKIDLIGLNLALKKDALSKKLKVPGAYQILLNNLKTVGNIYGIDNNYRIDIQNPIFEFDEDAEYLLFIGCMNAFESALAEEYVSIIRKKTPEATGLVHAGTTTPKEVIDFYKIMKLVGLRVKTLGKDEGCCGWPALVSGNESLFRKTLKKLAKNIKKAKTEKIITTCAMCYYVLNEYLPKVDVKSSYTVLHATDLILDLIVQNKIKLKQNNDKTTYHEGCYFGRYSEKYEGPRSIIQKIVGNNYIELEDIKKDAKCCGGSINFIYPDLALWIGKDLLDEAKEKNIINIVNTCPLCIMNIKYSVLTENVKINVLGISSYVYENINKE